MTRDRDLGDLVAYPGVRPKTWTKSENCEVMYLPARPLSLARALARESRRVDLDVLYLNSLFSPVFAILPMILFRVGLVRSRKMILAPRGETGGAAMLSKAWKKRPVACILRRWLLPPGLVWHASSEDERATIQNFLGTAKFSCVVELDPGPPANTPLEVCSQGHLHLVHLGRIVPIKNLLLTLNGLATLPFPAKLTVVGQLEDRGYWQGCLDVIKKLPPKIVVDVRGHMEREDIENLLATCDALVLPSRGENYGHAIAECLAHGLPVLIPDTTPWTALVREGGGWIIDEDDPRALTSALVELHSMSPGAVQTMRRNISDQYLRRSNGVAAAGSIFGSD